MNFYKKHLKDKLIHFNGMFILAWHGIFIHGILLFQWHVYIFTIKISRISYAACEIFARLMSRRNTVFRAFDQSMPVFLKEYF